MVGLTATVVATLCALSAPQSYDFVHQWYRAEQVLSEEGEEYVYPPTRRMYEVKLAHKPSTALGKKTFRLRFDEDPNGSIYEKFFYSPCRPVT